MSLLKFEDNLGGWISLGMKLERFNYNRRCRHWLNVMMDAIDYNATWETRPQRSLLMQIVLRVTERHITRRRRETQNAARKYTIQSSLAILRLFTIRSCLLDVVRWNALRDSTPLHICPTVSAVASDQDESITLCHVPLHITAGLIVIQRLHILKFLGTSAWRHCRTHSLRSCQ